MKYKVILAAAAVLASVGAQAIIFNVRTIASAPLSNGASFTTTGNSISFMTPNALVGDASPTRAGILNIEYDVDAVAGSAVHAILANLGVVAFGSGNVFFTEQAFEITALNGSEVGGAIGSLAQNFNAASNPNWSGSMNLSRSTRFVRVKKTFTLAAAETQDLDMAGIAINNQAIVPEPASLLALALGTAVLLRRKR